MSVNVEIMFEGVCGSVYEDKVCVCGCGVCEICVISLVFFFFEILLEDVKFC